MVVVAMMVAVAKTQRAGSFATRRRGAEKRRSKCRCSSGAPGATINSDFGDPSKRHIRILRKLYIKISIFVAVKIFIF